MEKCIQAIRTRHELSSFELVTGEGWTVVFGSDILWVRCAVSGAERVCGSTLLADFSSYLLTFAD